jgi:hypothetical protein
MAIAIVCYFSHNVGKKSAGKEGKMNPSEADFKMIRDYKKAALAYLNQRFNGGTWQNA